jgi:hypothetical protein
MDTIEPLDNNEIKKIHQMVYDELKTKYKINKFVKECKKLQNATSFGDLNRQINELIPYYDNYKNIKFNRDIDDFYLSDIEYIIFYYFRENEFNYTFLEKK